MLFNDLVFVYNLFNRLMSISRILYKNLFLTLDRYFAKTRQFELFILLYNDYLFFQTSHTKFLVFTSFNILFFTSFYNDLLLLKLLL